MKKTIPTLIMLIIFSLSLSGFCFAQEKTIGVPEDIEEAKEMGERAIEIGKRRIPETIKELWNERVLPMWKKMYEWFKVNIWLKIQPRIEEEIERRVPIIKEEFEKEKQEMKEELPEITKTLWERLKELWE